MRAALTDLGIGGYEGWRWIFIIEGLATVLMGVAVFWLLPNSPDHAAGRWLTQDEARFLRLNNILTRGIKKKRGVNADGKKERVKWGILGQVAKDWQIYLQAMIFASNAVPNYGLKLCAYLQPPVSRVRPTDSFTVPCPKSSRTWVSRPPKRN